MAHSEGGAAGTAPIKTKKALKEALAADANAVEFYSTSAFGNEWSGPIAALPEGTTLIIVGPDPYRARNWYASVKRSGTKITVS